MLRELLLAGSEFVSDMKNVLPRWRKTADVRRRGGDGTVRRLEYIGGHPLVAESALKAVKGWKYEAAPKESTTAVELKF